MVIGWLILALYLLGYVALWRTVVWFITNDMKFGSRIDGEDLVIGIVAGSILTMFWPAILAGISTKRLYAKRGHDITSLVIPRAHKRKVLLVEREQRIAQLERELEIR